MILPAAVDRDVVIFKVLPGLAYPTRLWVSFFLIAAGMFLQFGPGFLEVGCALVLLGNLPLLVSGYDNRVDFGRFVPDAQWETVEREKLDDLVLLDRKMRKWDASAMDITNALGAVVFVMMTGILVLLTALLKEPARFLPIDAMILLIPHWFTGIRSILVKPKLLTRVGTIRHLLERTAERLAPHRTKIMMLLEGDETKLPSDVKFRIDPKGAPEDFLGLYGQVVLNDVQGHSYPYFYVVLVGKLGYGLDRIYDRYQPPENIITEYKEQDQVEVLVIRQYTTKRSGYHCKPATALRILNEGIDVAEQGKPA